LSTEAQYKHPTLGLKPILGCLYWASSLFVRVKIQKYVEISIKSACGYLSTGVFVLDVLTGAFNAKSVFKKAVFNLNHFF